MSNVWFTSDLHIGHAKIAEIRWPAMQPDYNPCLPIPHQPTVHDLILAHNWDQTVGTDDVVWVLGDISSGTKTAQLNALEWIKARPGIKHLIAGNHDSVHPLHRDSHKWLPIYLDGAFETVQMAAKRRIPLPEGHVTALLSHFPYTGDHTVLQRYPQWRLPDCGDYLLHGHIHSRDKTDFSGRIIHVGVDAWDYKPVSLDEIRQAVWKAEGES